MNKQPAVSVIVPVYKAETYLHRCVDSLLAQTFPDFEILLIDDGSPDRSGEICDAYAEKDTRVRVFHKENGGVSSARQCGIDNARGEYTIHADPDDWVEPDMLEALYKKAKETDADMVICDFYEEFAGKQRYVRQRPSALDHETVLRELFQQLHGSCWNKLVRRACYNDYNVSFSPELYFCEDLFCNASLLLYPLKIVYINLAFYHYDKILNNNSLSCNYNEKYYDYDVFLRKKICFLLRGTKVYEIAENYLCLLIVNRAYEGLCFTEKEFRKRCLPFRKHAFIGACSIYLKIKLGLACFISYKFSLMLYSVLFYIKTVLIK